MKRTQVFISRRSSKKFLIAEENVSTAQSKYFWHPSVSMTLYSYVITYLFIRPCFIKL